MTKTIGNVIVVCPGGVVLGGGIGRQMGYFLERRETSGSGVTYTVIDSRGPSFVGKSPRHIVLAMFCLAGAIVRLVSARLSGTPSIAHINIAGRGSTLRKTILATVARCIGLPYLLHVHDYDYAEDYRRRGGIMQAAVRGAFRGAVCVLVLGAREREALAKLLGLRPDQILVWHNAAPDPHPDMTRARSPGSPCHLLFLGHLSARKGLPELMRALATPALSSRQWRATLAGIGAMDEFRRLAAELGIAQRVEFPGWLDQDGVRAACSDAEVLVLPSHAEGMAIALLEGLSYGLAVVTTPVGAHAEVVEPEISGLFVPPGDVDALAAALLRVIDDDALRDRLRQGARRRFLEKFDMTGYSARLGQLHADLLTGRPKVGAMGPVRTGG